MTRIFYDTEFVDTGKIVEFISIGMVSDDGREYYAVSNDVYWPLVVSDEWHMANVVPSLPHKPNAAVGEFDWDHPDFKTREQIAEDVSNFVKDTANPELWAWYAAYDHVALAQLFGRMLDMPAHIPKWTNDLRTVAHQLGNPVKPKQASVLHNALSDARWNQTLAHYYDELSTISKIND